MICSEIPTFKEFSFQQFIQTLQNVISRSFGTPSGINKEDELYCIVPFVDMFNHSQNASLHRYYCDDRKGFVVEALKNVSAGEEMYIMYSESTNHNYYSFYNYGFVSPNCIYGVNFKLGIDEKFPAYVTKQIALAPT